MCLIPTPKTTPLYECFVSLLVVWCDLRLVPFGLVSHLDIFSAHIQPKESNHADFFDEENILIHQLDNQGKKQKKKDSSW
jgi:hypothetical protein